MAAAEDWFRFSAVRDPARRLWSAWQSKLLLRQPEFVRTFGEEPWFPSVPSSPEEVLESYQRFVAALDGDESQRPKDPHWGLQTELLGEALPLLTHVGRVEALDDTLKLLGEHVASFGRDLPEIRRENTTPLPLPDGLLSDQTTRIIREQYAPDFHAFGYDEPETTSPSEDAIQEWKDRTSMLLDSVRAIILRNERLATLDHSLRRTSHRVKQMQQGNENLRQGLAQRDEKLRQLRQGLAQRDEKLRQLRQGLAQRDEKLRQLRQGLAQRDEKLRQVEHQLEELHDMAKVREERIIQLRGRVATLVRELRTLRASSSWRLTAPLRQLAGAVKRLRRSVFGHPAPSQDPRPGAEG